MEGLVFPALNARKLTRNGGVNIGPVMESNLTVLIAWIFGVVAPGIFGHGEIASYVVGLMGIVGVVILTTLPLRTWISRQVCKVLRVALRIPSRCETGLTHWRIA